MGSGGIAHEQIAPIDELDSWTSTLTQVATQPLEFCEDFPAIAQRYEAWWAQANSDRPIFYGTADADPSRPITRRLELLENPEAWFETKLADMRQTYCVGDAVPSVRVDFGPVMLGPLFGGQMHFDSDTTWTDAFINDDWSNAPEWTWSDDHPLWQQLRARLDLVAADAPGRYLVMTPDFGGSADVLLNLRGSTDLCMDVIEQPQQLTDAINAMYPSWRRAFVELYSIVVGKHGAGLAHWLGMWSSRPYMVPACDFNFMIGPDEFNAVCRPDIARQAATAGRAVFHLDGSGAARHMDALLEVPELQAIQYTPGAGTPSVRPWLDMFAKVQQAGKPLWVFCPADEVNILCDALRPEGLGIVTSTSTPAELDDLFAQFCRHYGR